MVSHFFFRYWDTRFQVLRYFVSVFQIRSFTTLSTPPPDNQIQQTTPTQTRPGNTKVLLLISLR